MGGDLSYLTQAELLALVAEQHRVIVQLQQRVAALEQQLKGKSGSGGPMPGTKPTNAPERPPADRKPRAEGFARRRAEPTERVDHALDCCPDCGTALMGGWVQRTREVLEVTLPSVRVIEHRFMARTCPTCERRKVPSAAQAGVPANKHRLGPTTLSLIAALRAVGRLPLKAIQWLLTTVYGLTVSEGGIVGALKAVAQQGQPAAAAIREGIRTSPVVHGDETGWRESGKNGYVWSFSTPTARCFVRGGRGKEMVDAVLGAGFSGVLVTDFYAAYDHYAGLHQRCWVHLLRDVHDLRRLYPEDTSLRDWALAVREVFDRGKAVTATSPQERQAEQRRLSDDLLAVCQPYLEDQAAAQGKLSRRIGKYLSELLTFVGDPTVPADNNAAERSLRPLVTQRKISGGTRSPTGTATTMTLATLFGTWRLQGLNPLTACAALLTSPQL